MRASPAADRVSESRRGGAGGFVRARGPEMVTATRVPACLPRPRRSWPQLARASSAPTTSPQAAIAGGGWIARQPQQQLGGGWVGAARRPPAWWRRRRVERTLQEAGKGRGRHAGTGRCIGGRQPPDRGGHTAGNMAAAWAQTRDSRLPASRVLSGCCQGAAGQGVITAIALLVDPAALSWRSTLPAACCWLQDGCCCAGRLEAVALAPGRAGARPVSTGEA